MVLRGLIFNNIHFRRVWGVERTDFGLFAVLEDLMVLKVVILDSF